MGDSLEYRRLRAPQNHGAALIDPPLDDAAELIRANRELGNQPGAADHWLHILQIDARRELCQTALRYTRAYRDISLPEDDHRPTTIILTGHQPQLFHPGVWFKNFALSSLASPSHAVAINLLIDNDTLNAPSVRVPTDNRPGNGTASAAEAVARGPSVAAVAFDRPGPAIPYEERTILDAETFNSFGSRTAKAIEPFVSQPLLRELWPLAIEAAGESANIGQCLARARHVLEGRWGLQSLELPLSHVSRTAPFCRFAARLLVEGVRLREIYNDALANYRRINRVRSHAHPVPDLAADDDWIETPFWVWSHQNPERRHLFVRSRGDNLELTDRAQWRVALAASGEPDGRLAEQLVELAQHGIAIRPRALITTMYARLVLSDLFLHGIGGAKYDQLTDVIIQRFLGLTPPRFVTLTATVRLPIALPEVVEDDRHACLRQLRELTYHPERHLDDAARDDPEAQRWATEKLRWTRNVPLPGSLRERHVAVITANERLQPYVAQRRARLSAQRDQVDRQLRERQMLGSREFSFCLFPAETLRPLLLDLSRAAV